MMFKRLYPVWILSCLLAAPCVGHGEPTVVEPKPWQSFTTEDLKAHFTRALTAEFYNVEGEFQVFLLRPQPALQLPAGEIELKLTSPPSGGLRSRILLRYQILVDGTKVHEGTSPVEVKVMREVLVSNRRLNRKESVTQGDLNLAMRDIVPLKEAPIEPNTDLSGYHVSYSMMKGTVLTERYLKRTPVVHRGDIVTGWFKRGLLQINLKLEVMEEAAPGQLVRVRNIKTKKSLRGIVYDESSIIFP